MKVLIAPVLLLFLLSACASAEHYFRIEEWGEGWELKVEDRDGRSFEANWVKGNNRSLQLSNYHEAAQGGFTVINTLYLEVDRDGNVRKGMLKRFAVPEMDTRHYAEGHARWWRVIEGWCRLDETGRGTLHVRCEGAYEFTGNVEPRSGIEIRRPE